MPALVGVTGPTRSTCSAPVLLIVTVPVPPAIAAEIPDTSTPSPVALPKPMMEPLLIVTLPLLVLATMPESSQVPAKCPIVAAPLVVTAILPLDVAARMPAPVFVALKLPEPSILAPVTTIVVLPTPDDALMPSALADSTSTAGPVVRLTAPVPLVA